MAWIEYGLATVLPNSVIEIKDNPVEISSPKGSFFSLLLSSPQSSFCPLTAVLEVLEMLIERCSKCLSLMECLLSVIALPFSW